jgi:DNA-binding PadR family transcriptional regulator
MSAAARPPRLPSLTHLQFLVLGALLGTGGEPRAGRELRAELTRYRVRRSAPAFYQMMARLEDAGWVEGFYTQQVVDSQIIKERGYRITAAGQRAWDGTRDFYVQTADRFAKVQHA